ncbi:hypothetical protein ACFL0H_14790, partial [Thermodesulfobacteriota bacterium]
LSVTSNNFILNVLIIRMNLLCFIERKVMDRVCRNLWVAVLKQAIKEARKDAGCSILRTQAWFYSDSREIGSYLWICSILDLNPESIRQLIKLDAQDTFADHTNRHPIEYRTP